MKDLKDITSRVAGAVLVGAVNCVPEVVQGLRIGYGAVGGMKRRVGVSGRILERRLDGVGYGGIRMVWRVEGEARELVLKDAKSMAKALGTTGAVESMLVSGGSMIRGTMPWSHGQGEMTWDDVNEVLREEGLL